MDCSRIPAGVPCCAHVCVSQVQTCSGGRAPGSQIIQGVGASQDLRTRTFYTAMIHLFHLSSLSCLSCWPIVWHISAQCTLFCTSLYHDKVNHCQRHNGPKVQHLKLELSCHQNRMPLALVKNLANMYCNQHWFQFWR